MNEPTVTAGMPAQQRMGGSRGLPMPRSQLPKPRAKNFVDTTPAKDDNDSYENQHRISIILQASEREVTRNQEIFLGKLKKKSDLDLSLELPRLTPPASTVMSPEKVCMLSHATVHTQL